MSGLPTTTTRSTYRVFGAVILLQALYGATPAAASSNSLAICDNGGKDLPRLTSTVLQPVAGIDANESDLATELADDASVPEIPSSRVKVEPRTAPSLPRATPRDSFSLPAANVIRPGILAEALARYRKQMYRKDI